MSIVLEAFQAAQEAFDSINGKIVREDRSEIYSLRHKFLERFKKSVALLARQKVEVKTESDQAALDVQIDYLARITALFLSRMPIRPWAGNAYELERVYNQGIFTAEQSQALRKAFTHALTRDMRSNPKDAEYFFINGHQFKDNPYTVAIFTDVLIANFADIARKNVSAALHGAEMMIHFSPDPDKCQQLLQLITDNIDKFTAPYIRISEGDIDPIFQFALWQNGERYEAEAIKLFETRVNGLALSAKTHAKHTYGPHVLTIPSETDDLHFDAYDAISNMVYQASNDGGYLALLQSAHRLFVKHFDVLAELHPSKAVTIAIELCSKLEWNFRDRASFRGTALGIEAKVFREDVLRLMSASLVERIDRIKYDLSNVDVASYIVGESADEGVRNLAIEAAVRRFEHQMSWEQRNQQIESLLYIAKEVGERHPQFAKITNMVVEHESSVSGIPTDKSIKDCLSLAQIISGKGSLRLSVLRCAKNLTELQSVVDPLGAEKNLAEIEKLCGTKREQSQVAQDITGRLRAVIVAIRPVTTGDQAVMDGVLSKYTA